MKTPEERRAEDRRRRTERQREKREQERICGWCESPADGGLIEWFGRGKALLIPICSDCKARLYGHWRDIKQVGFFCSTEWERPCPDCLSASPAEKLGPSFLRRLFSG